jgi:hypothetical protein
VDNIKMDLRNYDGVVWTALTWLRIGLMEGSCERGIEILGSTEFWEVPEQLYNWRLLKDSAP